MLSFLLLVRKSRAWPHTTGVVRPSPQHHPHRSLDRNYQKFMERGIREGEKRLQCESVSLYIREGIGWWFTVDDQKMQIGWGARPPCPCQVQMGPAEAGTPGHRTSSSPQQTLITMTDNLSTWQPCLKMIFLVNTAALCKGAICVFAVKMKMLVDLPQWFNCTGTMLSTLQYLHLDMVIQALCRLYLFFTLCQGLWNRTL